VNVVVFVGPTLPLEIARRELDAVFRPPAAQGDVYRAARSQPDAIVIVDGEFDHVPAVWHKEILWAMSRGVHVYGASSMGALRAAELCEFGMEGVGRIFEAYRDGALEDDDEVAIAHRPQAAGYQPTSEAMVNIRFTLDKARDGAIISEPTRAILERAAKDLFFPARTYPAILDRARERRCDVADLDRFARWWPRASVDQKREDAVEALRLVRTRHAAGAAPKEIAFVFQHTVCWQQLIDTADLNAPVEDGLSLSVQAVFDELWLSPADCLAAHAAARADGIDGSSASAARLLHQVKALKAYPTLVSRAQRKQALLDAHGLDDRGEGDEELQTAVLLRWHIEHPGDDALTRAFCELARANWRAFLRALIRQDYYQMAVSGSNVRTWAGRLSCNTSNG
jgi:hypothetical protein